MLFSKKKHLSHEQQNSSLFRPALITIFVKKDVYTRRRALSFSFYKKNQKFHNDRQNLKGLIK